MAKENLSGGKSKGYRFSDNTRKSTIEFGELNRTSALIMSRFKQVMNLSWDKEMLNKFNRRLLKIIRSGPYLNMGNRKLWDGDLTLLEGFHLNHRATASNLFRQSIRTKLDEENGITLSIDPFKYSLVFEKAHKRALVAEVRLFVFSFDFDSMSSIGRAITLISQKKDEDFKEPLEQYIPLDDNKLTILILKTSFKSGPNLSEIMDRQYIGATVLKVIYKRDGKIVTYTPEQKEDPPQSILPLPGEWQSLD